MTRPTNSLFAAIFLAMILAVVAPAEATDSNQPGYWGDDCYKVEPIEGEPLTYTADRNYRLVVLKAATQNFVFEDVKAGDVLQVGNGRAISHIIFCEGSTSSTTTSTRPTTSSTSTSTSTSTTTTETTTPPSSTTTTEPPTTSTSTPPSTTTVPPPSSTSVPPTTSTETTIPPVTVSTLPYTGIDERPFIMGIVLALAGALLLVGVGGARDDWMVDDE